MHRYDYSDPLAAAWMAKHFGMTFDAERPDGSVANADPIDESAFMKTEPRAWLGYRFIIRPESMALLQPRLGDLIERHDCFYFVVTDEEHASAEGVSTLRNQTVALSKVRAWPRPEETFIRMRGGMPFFVP
jgi:hypothetical protein